MKILAVLPASIGGRLTMQSIFDGFVQNGYEIFLFDKLSDNEKDIIQLCKDNKFDFIVGYDFAGLKIKVDNNLPIKSINYFSDVIEDNHSGNYWQDYYKYLFEPHNYTFYWDKDLFEIKKKEIPNLFYQPHFVNTDVYKNFNCNPENDIMFAGRLDTDFRLNLMLDLLRTFSDKKFVWYAIEKHYQNALSRTANDDDKKLLTQCYQGFISTEKDMAVAINNSKIFVNFNAQGMSSLNYRTFQVMACERVLVSDYRREIDYLFADNMPIVVYKDVIDMKNKINFYLKNIEEYKQIAKSARLAVCANHSSEICVRNMLNAIKNHP